MLQPDEVLHNQNTVKQLVNTPIVELDKYLQCIDYLENAKKELYELLVLINESIKLPHLINVLKALIDKIDEKRRMSSRQDIDQSILFVVSHIKAIKYYISHEKGENNRDVPLHFQKQHSVLKGLIKKGLEILKILGNPQIDPIDIPKRDINAVFSAVSDNYDYESAMVTQQKSLVDNASFKQFLNQIWVQSIRDGLPSKRILISYAWPLQNDKYQNEKGEFVEAKEMWVQEFLQNLVNFLIKSGMVVYFDKNNSGGGFVLSDFMRNKIKKADHCLIISTRTLGHKMRLGRSGVSYEYEHMKLRMKNEPQLQSKRFIIPVLLNNNFYGSKELAEIGEILFCYRGFLYGYESLIKSLYRYGDSIDLLFLKYRNYLEQIINPPQFPGESSINKVQAKRSQLNFHLFNFQPRNRNFIGRVNELSKLTDHIKGQQKAYSTELTLSVVVASGGMGKSLLVNEFAHQFSGLYELVCLIPAENVQQIESSYIELASDLDIKCNKENLIKELRKWWRAHSRCLVIFDNAKSYDQIEKYLPLEGCDVVITSQFHDWPAGTVLKIDGYSLDDARNYIINILNNRSKDTPEKIIRLMVHTHCFPLHLALACAHIKKADMDIDEYISLEMIQKEQLYNSNLLPAGDRHSSVYMTCSIAMRAIEQANPLSAMILKSCAYLYSEHIPYSLFSELYSENNNKIPQSEIDAALELLAKYSLLEIVNVYDQHKIFKIHRVIQEVLRFDLAKNNSHAYFVKLLYFIFLRNMKYGYQNASRDNILQKKMLGPHIASLLLILDELPEIKTGRQDELSFNTYLNEKGEESLYEIDSSLMQSLYNSGSTLLPSQDKHINQPVVQLAQHDRNHNAIRRHVYHCQRANTIQQPATTQQHSHVKMVQKLSISPLIIHKHIKGNNKNSSQVYGAKQAPQQFDLCSLHLYILSLLNDIYTATINISRRKLTLQRILYIKKLRFAQFKTMYELDEVRKTFSNLAGVFETSNDAIKSKLLHEKALFICETMHNDDHPEIAIMLLNYSCALYRLHEYAQQAQYLMRAKEILEKHAANGQHYPEIANIIMSLGLNFLMKGRSQDAHHLINRAHDTHTSHSTEITSNYINMLCNVAVMNGDMGLHQQECDLLVQALDLHKQYYREINLGTAKLYISVANAKCKVNCVDEALLLFKDANEIFIKAGLIDSEERASLLANMSNAHGILGQNSIRETLLNEALQIFIKNNVNMRAIDVAHIYIDLVDVEMRKSQPNNKLIKDNCCLALDIMLSQHYQIKKITSLLAYLGGIFIKIGEPKFAQQCYIKIIQHLPENKLAHENLACMYHVTGDNDLAEKHFKLAIQYGCSLSVLCDYSLLLMRQKRFDEVIDSLISCINNEADKSGLVYSQLELPLHDNYLQQEIKICVSSNDVYKIKGVYLAHYLLFRAFQSQGNNEYENVLKHFQDLIDKNPNPTALRLISFIYKDLKRYADEQKCLSRANELIKTKQNLESSKTGRPQLSIDKPDNASVLIPPKQYSPGM